MRLRFYLLTLLMSISALAASASDSPYARYHYDSKNYNWPLIFIMAVIVIAHMIYKSLNNDGKLPKVHDKAHGRGTMNPDGTSDDDDDDGDDGDFDFDFDD